MAKKPLPTPSSSEDAENKPSSDDDEEEQQIPYKPVPRTPSKPESDDSEADSSDSSDSETAPAPQKIQPMLSQPTPQSKSGDDSASESESDHESAKLVNPIISKPMAAPAESDPVVKSSDHAGDNNNNSSKLNGKALFQRVWSLDDEITIIEAIAEYQSGRGPIKIIPTGIGGFYDFVKGRLSFKVTATQLAGKIRSLKKKYSSVAGRVKEGKPVKFAKSHDEKVYKLSEKLWGKGNEEDGEKGKEEAEAGITVNGRERKGKRHWPLLEDTLRSMGNKMIVGELLEGVDGKKAGVCERKLKKQKMVEVKHHIARADLIKESIKLVLEGLERAEY